MIGASITAVAKAADEGAALPARDAGDACGLRLALACAGLFADSTGAAGAEADSEAGFPAIPGSGATIAPPDAPLSRARAVVADGGAAADPDWAA